MAWMKLHRQKPSRRKLPRQVDGRDDRPPSRILKGPLVGFVLSGVPVWGFVVTALVARFGGCRARAVVSPTLTLYRLRCLF